MDDEDHLLKNKVYTNYFTFVFLYHYYVKSILNGKQNIKTKQYQHTIHLLTVINIPDMLYVGNSNTNTYKINRSSSSELLKSLVFV